MKDLAKCSLLGENGTQVVNAFFSSSNHSSTIKSSLPSSELSIVEWTNQMKEWGSCC